ncbi:MAG: DUF1848 family protein [Deferrisomatales bacterium]|nr:DUF1848 family protein [Deferrisomatales bacterium]
MIVSASRRTDLPAVHAGWLLDRLAAGFAEVRHPFAPSRVRRVDLVPAPAGSLEALVLWTRNPAPLLEEVPRWEAAGLRTLWLVTLTGYPRPLEPRSPPPEEAAAALRLLGSLVGSARIAWRYDPVLLCPSLGMDVRWHLGNFRRLAALLEGAAGRCIVSLYDDYPKARRRLAAAGLAPAPAADAASLLSALAEEARGGGIPLQACCEAELPADVPPGSCIDGPLLDRLWDLGVGSRRDPGQRAGCRCAPSVDIGAYDTCTHGCLYCYATRRHGERPPSTSTETARDPAGRGPNP